jgi:hypothetical protein
MIWRISSDASQEHTFHVECVGPPSVADPADSTSFATGELALAFDALRRLLYVLGEMASGRREVGGADCDPRGGRSIGQGELHRVLLHLNADTNVQSSRPRNLQPARYASNGLPTLKDKKNRLHGAARECQGGGAKLI